MKGKKLFAFAAAAAMIVASVPLNVSAAPVQLVKYDFENGTGMGEAGMGTPPSVVQDAERGNVLQFADGTGSKIIVRTPEHMDLNEDSLRYEPGTPSALKFDNPYVGKSMTGATIAYWVKTSYEASNNGAGILGFISETDTKEHPDKTSGLEGKEHLEDVHGEYLFGVTVGNSQLVDHPMVSFTGMLHNNFGFNEEEAILGDDKWHYVVLSLKDGATAEVAGEDNITKVYVDGEEIDGARVVGKRYNHGECGNDSVYNGYAVNAHEITLMEFFARSDLKAYVGESGSADTSSEVFLDDLTFYEGAASADDVKTMYAAAQASGGAVQSGQDNTGGSNNNADNQAGGDSNNSADAGNGGSSNTGSAGSNNSGSNNSSGRTNTANSSGSQAANLPQTGVMDSSLFIACGVAAVAAGALLFRKKETKDQQ